MMVLSQPVMVGAAPCRDLGMQGERGLWPTMSSLVATRTSWPAAWALHSYTWRYQNSENPEVRPATSHPAVILRHAGQHQLGHALAQSSRGRLNTIIVSPDCSVSPPSSGLTSDPAIFWPFLYQAVLGVGLPVAEQVSVTAPETRPITREGGRSLNRTNLSPP